MKTLNKRDESYGGIFVFLFINFIQFTLFVYKSLLIVIEHFQKYKYKYTLLLNTKAKTLQSDKGENDILQQAIISLKRLKAVSLKTKIAKK